MRKRAKGYLLASLKKSFFSLFLSFFSVPSDYNNNKTNHAFFQLYARVILSLFFSDVSRNNRSTEQ